MRFLKMMPPLAFRAAFALEVAVIVTLSLISPSALPGMGITWGDKVGHLLAYGVTAGTGFFAFPRRWLVVAGLLTLGLGLEAAQAMGSAGRTAEVGDMIANAAGIGLALAVERLARRGRTS